jgi:protein involved in polysaccharide export with SLBB domain
MKIFSVCLIFFASISSVLSQNDLLLGKPNPTDVGAFYDLSDPTGVNIEVNLWGFVRFPGKYKVPYKTTFLDLMSYGGGPSEDSDLESIRIYRRGNDTLSSKSEIIKLNYDDLLWSNKISSVKKMNPDLKSGDVVIIPQHTRYTYREDISFFLSVFTSLISIITLLLTISLTRR